MFILADCKSGDKVVLYLTDDGHICSFPTFQTIKATVLHIHNCRGTNTLLGWGLNEKLPADAWTILSNPTGVQGYEQFLQGCVFCTWVEGDKVPVHWIISSIATVQEVVKTGYNCLKCNARNEWAEANRPNDRYECFECRR